MDLQTALSKLPDDANGAVVVLSGGMDSTIAMRLCVEKYGAKNVRAITFNYGQKQAYEIKMAAASTNYYRVSHKVLDLSVLGDISQGFSANVDKNIAMPTIQDVLGAPQPKTYVPNRNMIMYSLAAAYAETQKINQLVVGLQVHDEYGYHDTTQRWVDKMNDVLSENRTIKIKIHSPFSQLSKLDEIDLLLQMETDVGMLAMTMTCYNPPEDGVSCGRCPSCSERIANFAKAGIKDPLQYAVDIPWEKLCAR